MIKGNLFSWFETGLEGVVWALQDEVHEGYSGLHIIEEGDYLEILNRDGSVAWCGVIKADRQTGLTPHPTNPEFQQQHALGVWIHWVQEGFEPDDWASFFVPSGRDYFRANLTKKGGNRQE